MRSAIQRPFEIKFMSVAWGITGLVYAIAPLVAIFLGVFSLESIFILGGFCLSVAAVGLWLMEDWWLFPYGVFFGLRLAVRFPDDILAGGLLDILSYVCLALFWLLMGFRMKRTIERHRRGGA